MCSCRLAILPTFLFDRFWTLYHSEQHPSTIIGFCVNQWCIVLLFGGPILFSEFRELYLRNSFRIRVTSPTKTKVLGKSYYISEKT